MGEKTMYSLLRILSCYCFCLSLALIGVTAVAATEPAAQEVLHVYGSEGPFPPIHEAAQIFNDRNKVQIDVMSGPTDKWVEKAGGDADVIFASAAFMMSNFVHVQELQIVPDTVTPLYMRPSAILVRPGNPKQIGDFPDLLKPGVRVMVVTGSGQTGLWEDMAGKKGDVGTIRALHENIVLYAANSTEAVAAWRQKDDIDAWVTWSIWHMPLHDHADLVHVSEDYVIYRQCFVALTQRGKGKPKAVEFVAFLKSKEGAKVFESWDWMVTPPGSKPLNAPKPQER
jgi:accessory colonization factor AcfC